MTKDERNQKLREAFKEFINSIEKESPELAETMREIILTDEYIEYLIMNDYEKLNRICAVLSYKAKDET